METPIETPLVPTPASEWKGKREVEGTDLPLPSGNVARVRRMSPEAFLTSGVIPDPLTDIVVKAIHTKKGLPPTKLKQMAEDPKQIQASLEMFDRVLAWVVIAPSVRMPPPCVECEQYYNVDARHQDQDFDGYHAYVEGTRNPNILYADQVDLKDKVFVFQFCLGGTRDLTKFREQLPPSMGSLFDGQDLQLQAK